MTETATEATTRWEHRGDGYSINSIDEDDQFTDVPDDDMFTTNPCESFTNSFGDCSVVTIDGIQYIRIQSDNFSIISRFYKNC